MEAQAAHLHRGSGPNTQTHLRVCLVEDSCADAELVRIYLEEALPHPVDLRHFRTVGDATATLAQQAFDCALLDLSLPDADGVAVVEEVRAAASDLPIVILTGSDDDALEVEVAKHGAMDYLIKDQISPQLLGRAVRYAIERGRIQLELERRSLYDSLTDLANRSLFEARLEAARGRARRAEQPFAVLLLDLNRFKLINDTLGHDVGDSVLAEVARRLTDAVRPDDTIARIGGDEFAVICEGLESPSDAEAVASRVAEFVSSEPVSLPGRDLTVEVAIGIVFGDGQEDNTALIRHAELAMYQSKGSGQGYQVFSEGMEVETLERFEVEAGLRRALEEDGLVLHYQPLVRTHGEEIFGFEALVRWDDPERGMVPPGRFIPIAEELGLMVPLGRWVMVNACRQLKRWQEQTGDPSLMMSVNLSAGELTGPDLVEFAAETLAQVGLEPSSLCIELTESQIVTGIAGAAETLAGLRALGIRVAIDDFGTGYSSLEVLASYQFDYVKIDRSIVTDLDRNGRKRRLMQGLGGLARALRITPIAEGVERDAEAHALRELGCVYAQGFHYARPAAADRLEIPGVGTLGESNA